MNERQIQNALFDHHTHNGAQLVCPNYTPGANWWENDLFLITKSGLWVEYEVKCTKADFLKDAEKSTASTWEKRSAVRRGVPVTGHTTKHEKLASGSMHGPNRFFFVTPQGLLTADMIPPWAGWVEIKQRGKRLIPVVRSKAKLLHDQHVAPSIIEHCRSVFYYRFWNLRRKTTDAELANDCGVAKTRVDSKSEAS